MFLFAQLDSWMLLGGMSLLVYLLLRQKTRRRGPTNRQQAIRPAKPDNQSSALPLYDAPPEVLRWQVEMHELARDMKGELDSKMVALQSLIRMAQEERERLEALLTQLESHRKDA